MSAKVSIIVPVYNMDLYIENTLKSLINQTYRNIEIICVDDGSRDNSAQIIKSFEKKDNRIKYVYKENSGVSDARNVGLELSHGDYIMFVDGDDFLHHQAVEIFTHCIEQKKCDVVCSSYSIVFDLNAKMINIDNYNLNQIDVSKLYLENKRGFSVWAKIIKADIAKKFRFYSGVTMGEDACYMGMIFNEKITVYDIDKPLYYYFRNDFIKNHTDTATSCGFNYKHISILFGLDKLNDYLRYSDMFVVKDFFLVYMIKSLLTYRSMLIGSEYEKEGLKICNNFYNKWSKTLQKNKRISFKIKISLFLLYRFRFIYEIGRIITDPSMRNFYKDRQKNRS